MSEQDQMAPGVYRKTEHGLERIGVLAVHIAANRWAVFTTDQLHDLWQILVAYPRGGPVDDDTADRFTVELEVEIERRQSSRDCGRIG